MPYALVRDSLEKGLGSEGPLSLLMLCSDRELRPFLEPVLKHHPHILTNDARYRDAPSRPGRYPDLIAAGLDALAADTRQGWFGSGGFEDLLRHIGGRLGLVIGGASGEALERMLLDHLAVHDEKNLERALVRPEFAERLDHVACALRLALLRRSKREQLGLPRPAKAPASADGVAPVEPGWVAKLRSGVLGSLDDLLDALSEGERSGLGRLAHCNVLVAGRTGAGKSTLVNAVFGVPMAAYGTGRPVTRQATWYEHPGRPVRLCDTRGLERGQFKETIGALRAVLTGLRAKPDPTVQPHVAWLCIDASTARVEPGEQRLCELLTEFGVPVVCVLTKSWSSDDLSPRVPKLLPGARSCVRVLVDTRRFESGRTVAPFGLDGLVTATLALLPEGVKRGFAAVQTVALEPKVKSARIAINTAAGLAATAAAAPIPFSDAVALVPIQVGMFVGISRAVGLDIREDAAKPLIAIVLGTTVATFGGRMIASGLANLAKMIPGVGSIVGGTITATVAGTITHAMGEAYLEFLTGYHRKNGRLPTVEELAPQFRQWWASREVADKVG